MSAGLPPSSSELTERKSVVPPSPPPHGGARLPTLAAKDGLHSLRFNHGYQRGISPYFLACANARLGGPRGSSPLPLSCLRAVGDCPMPGRLHRAADRPPADGDATDLDQVRRVRFDPRRRPRLQTAELDEPSLHTRRARTARPRPKLSIQWRAVDGALGSPGARWRHAPDRAGGAIPRLLTRTWRRPWATERRRRGASAGAARRTPRGAGTRSVIG